MKNFLFILLSQTLIVPLAYSGAEAILGSATIFGTINVAITQSRLNSSACGSMETFYQDPSCLSRPNSQGQYADSRIENTFNEAQQKADSLRVQVTNMYGDVVDSMTVRPRDILNHSNCQSVNQFLNSDCELHPNAPEDVQNLQESVQGRGRIPEVIAVNGINLNESVEIASDRSCRFMGPANSFTVFKKPNGCGSAGHYAMTKVCEAVVQCGENSLLNNPKVRERFPNAQPGVPIAVKCTESPSATGNSISGCQITPTTCLLNTEADEVMSEVIDQRLQEPSQNAQRASGALRR